MTPDEIRSHPAFTLLNERKQAFVEALLSNGNDKVAAAHSAWKCSNNDSARAVANRALKDESVAYLVDAYFGTDPARMQFTRIQALEFAASKARGIDDPKLALDYLKLIVQMNGWLVKPADSATPDEPQNMNDEFVL